MAGSPPPTFEHFQPVTSTATAQKQTQQAAQVEGTQTRTAATRQQMAIKAQQAQDAADKKAKAEQDAADAYTKQAQQFYSDMQVTMGTINRLRQLVGPGSAGWGSSLKDLPESDAKEVHSLLQQLQRSSFLNTLAEMKAGSKTGSAGIGRILQSEVPIFAQRWGSLDQARRPEDLLDTVNTMDTQLRRMWARINGDGSNLDSPDPATAYLTRQKYGVLRPGEQPGEAPRPALYKDSPADELLKPGSPKSQPIPPEMQSEYEKYTMSNLGNLDPDQYAAFRLGLDKKYGFPTPDSQRETYKQEATMLNDRAAQKAPINLQIPPTMAPPSEAEQATAKAVANPVLGPALSAAAGATGAFTSDTLAPAAAYLSGRDPAEIQRMQAMLEAAHPNFAAAGRFAGGVGQAVALPAGVVEAGGGIPYMGASSALSGAMTHPEDRIGGAATAGAEGALLGGATKGVTAVARGAGPGTSELATKYNIPMTPGEVGMSPTLRFIESKLAAVPGIGAGVRNRMQQGNIGFNQAAIDDALQHVGVQGSGKVGHPGVQDAFEKVGDAYDSTLRGVAIPTTDAYREQVDRAMQAAGQADPKYTALLQKQLGPLLDKPVLTGDDIQQVLMRTKAVGAAARDENGAAWANYVQPHLNNIDKATVDAVSEAGMPEVAQNLNNANAAYRKLSIISDATNKSLDNGGVFTPDSLLESVRQNVLGHEGANALARGEKSGGAELPLFPLATGAANKATGLRAPQTSGAYAIPATLGALGVGEGLVEGALSPTDDKAHPEKDYLSPLMRNALYTAALGTGVRGAYSEPVMSVLQRAMTRPASAKALPSLLAKYGPYGAAQLPAKKYVEPKDKGAIVLTIPQLPPPSGNYKGLYSTDLSPAAAPTESADTSGLIFPPNEE